MNQLGPYELVDRIASGGMGEIYVARLRREAGFQKLVAVKRILPHLADDAAFVRMFEAEARLSALLNHRNIVHVYDFGREGREAWLAMELVDGFDLRALLDLAHETGRPLPLGFSVRIAADCARALDYAWRREGENGEALRIVHRDVSPQNILVSMEGEVKLTDFGLAKTLTLDGGSTSGLLKGKLAYMAPEQVRGGAVDTRSDLFALGAVLFEMLSGRRLYSTDLSFGELAIAAQAASYPPLEVALADVPSRLRSIVASCLSPEPARRFESGTSLERALREAAAELGVDEPSWRLAEYLRPFASRRRLQLETAEDGTVVSKKPIVRRSGEIVESDPAAFADTAAGQPLSAEPPAVVARRTPEPAAPDPGVTIALPSASESLSSRPRSRRPLFAGVGVAVAAGLAVALWPRPPTPDAVAPPLPAMALREPAEGQRWPSREAEPTPPAPAVLALTSAPAGARCFLFDVLRDVQRPLDCAGETAVEPGPWRVVVAKDGLDQRRIEVVLEAGVRKEIDAALAPPPVPACTVRVVTEPAGATVELDGLAQAGRTPLDLEQVEPGPHRIAVSKAGYASASAEYVCGPDAPKEVRFPLGELKTIVTVGPTRHALRLGTAWSGNVSAGGVVARVRVTARASGADVTIDASPYATVVLDGRELGVTPRSFSLAAGRAAVARFKRDGKDVGALRLKAIVDEP